MYSRRKLSTVIILFYVQILWSKISADYAVCRLLNRWKIRSTKFFRAELSGDDEDLLTRICTLGSAPHCCFVPRKTCLISTHYITYMFHFALDCKISLIYRAIKIVAHHFKHCTNAITNRTITQRTYTCDTFKFWNTISSHL